MAALPIRPHNVARVGITGAEIQARRIALQMTVKALADKAGVDRGQLSKIEAGSNARDSTLGAIERALLDAEAAEKVVPAEPPKLVTFRLKGNFGVDVTVEGPVDNLSELAAEVGRLARQIGAAEALDE